MDVHTLESLIQMGESETIEFKKSTSSLSKAGETLCAFLNGKGGQVVIGLTDKGEIVGQDVSDRTLQEIAYLFKKFEPSPVIEINKIKVNRKEVVVLSALPRKYEVPYTFDRRPYQRIESTTTLMSQQIYERLLLERNHNHHRWETEIAFGYEIDDLDVEEVLKTIRSGIESGRIPDQQVENIPFSLDRLGVRKEGKLLNAAIVLFGKKFLPFFTQCQLRLARFKGVDKTEFIDQNQVLGHAFSLLDDAMLFLRRHLPIAGRVIPGVLERKDEPLFPLSALREALVNAFCHRSYTELGGAVSIAIFDDRLEIWNNGSLPFGLKAEDLKRDHVSLPRNPLIAQVFYQRGLIERWGSGTQKIVNLCVKAGHPEPVFSEQANSILVRFLASEYIAPNKVVHDLTNRQRKILQFIASSGERGSSFANLKSEINSTVPERTLQEDCQHLKRLGLIEVLGFGRGAKWRLVNKT